MLNELAIAVGVELWFQFYRMQTKVIDTPKVREAFGESEHVLTVNIFDFVRCQGVLKSPGGYEVLVEERPDSEGRQNGR